MSRICPLSGGPVFVTPLGRRCEWVPSPYTSAEWFRYLDDPQQDRNAVTHGHLMLSSYNLRLLRTLDGQPVRVVR